MISVCVKKTEARPEAVLVGDPAGDTTHHYNGYINSSSSQKQRPLSSVSDSALSGLRLNGEKMATQGHPRTPSRSRGVSTSPKWLAERSYSVFEEGTRPESDSPSWHLQPIFPDISAEKNSRDNPRRLSKIIKRDSWAESLLKKQSKIEQEYKGIRDFTRSKSNSASRTTTNCTIEYKPPKGYTNFVAGKPLMYQVRPPSGRERAHKRFLEKLEAQNRMLQDLSDSDDDEDRKNHKGVLNIPSCSDMDVCLHGSCSGSGGGLSIQLAMDGLRIANGIERSLSKAPSLESPSKDEEPTLKGVAAYDKVKDKNAKCNELSESQQKSYIITTGNSSTKPGKQYNMNTKTPPEKITQLSEGSCNAQRSNHAFIDNANNLYHSPETVRHKTH